MRKLIILLLVAPCFGQAFSNIVLQNSQGNYARVKPYAQVTLCASTDSAVPCTTKATTYTTDARSVQCTQNASSGFLPGAPTSGTGCNNPGSADANGNFTIFAVPGLYRLCVKGETYLCQEVTVAGGGGTANPAPPVNAIQYNHPIGTLAGSANFTFDGTTFTLPDATTWAAGGIVAPTNALIALDGSFGVPHGTGFDLTNSAGVVLFTGQVSGTGSGGQIGAFGSTHPSAPSDAQMVSNTSGSTVALAVRTRAFADQLGFTYGSGGLASQINTGPSYHILDVNYSDKSVHAFGPLVLPNDAGTGYSYGPTGSLLVSLNTTRAPEWSGDLTTVFSLKGTSGTCTQTPSGSQNGICFGPGNNLQGWDANISAAWQNVVLANNVPVSGLIGIVPAAQGGTGIDSSASTGVAVDTAGTWSFLSQLTPAKGGTGQDTSGSTGVAQVSSGTWSVSAALANGTTATTQSASDNSTKVATTAYIDGKTIATSKGGTGGDSSAAIGVAQVSSGTWSYSTALANGTTATTQSAASNDTKAATDAYVDRVAQGVVLDSNCVGTVGTGNATTYTLAPFNQSGVNCNVTTVTEAPLPITCTAKNLYVTASAAGGAAGSGVVTLYKGGSSQALTCTLGTTTSCNDTTHTVSITAGNTWSIRILTGQATDTTANVRVAFQCL